MYSSICVDADVLDHADAGDRVERLAGQLAVVHDADVDPVADARLGRPLARQRGLRLRQRDAGDRHAVLARGVDREAAPAAADVEHPLALLAARASCTRGRASPLCAASRLDPSREKNAQL